MSVMDETVQDGVGVGGIADRGVPAVHRKLTGQNDGAAIVPVVDDLHEIAALGRGQVYHRPIVQNQDADSADLAHQPAHAIAEPGDGEIIEQPRQTRVQHAVPLAGGLIAQRTGNPAFARPGFPGHDQMAVFADPAAGEQIADHALVQAARRLHVEVLEAGGLTQARLSQTGEQGRVGAIGRLAVDQQGELVGKIQLAAIGEARTAGRRVIAVGTTVARALESAGAERLEAGSAETALFIRPGFRFRFIDGLITNFHLPGSTLLMLVAAFAGLEPMRNAYAHAVQQGYRFFSYGDAMLIWPATRA